MSPVGPSLTSLVRPVQTVWAQDLSLGVSIFVMRNRLGLAALALSLAVGACNQDAPTGANSVSEGQETAPQFKKGSSTLLANVPVTGTASNGTIFTGTATIKKFAFDQKTGTLLVSGTVQDATGRVVGKFNRVPATLAAPAAVGDVGTAAVCSILDLDIGAIHLNLLGLVVDLAPIHLDITGQTGPGQLLGNLLCGLAGLLDGFPLNNALAQILAILQQINQLLG